MLRVVIRLVAGAWAACFVLASAAPDVSSFERAVAADPENLRVAAEYRQTVVQTADFDRAIRFLDDLAKRTRGPNVQISLALAYVDKVPAAGELRQLYLGRDAINALTRAIERQPTVLAHYVRGRINLYFNNFIFHRVPRGIADLERARALATPATPPALVRRVYAALGDGHFKIGEITAAREVWNAGLEQFPGDADLKARLAPDTARVQDIVNEALDPRRRIDTSLVDLIQKP